jgi:adenylyltransferase/sulfurtransferase
MRSILFPGSDRGQEQIGRTAVALVGVGAVGPPHGEIAGAGGLSRVTVLDLEAVVEGSNAPRQHLFDAGGAEAVAVRPRPPRRTSAIDPSAMTVGRRGPRAVTAREILAGHDLVFDGSDNFETRRARLGRLARARADLGLRGVRG